MTTTAINWDNDLTPAVILLDVFTYAGHTMSLGIFEDETSNDISWTVASTFSTPIEGGVYPRHFAELEACEILSELIVTNNVGVESVIDMVKVLKDNATRSIAKGVFGEVA